MADGPSIRSELRRPVPLILLVAAILGWAGVIFLAISRADIRSDLQQEVRTIEESRIAIADQLAGQQAASGTLDTLTIELEQARAGLAQASEERQTVQDDLTAQSGELEQTRQSLTDDTARLAKVRAEIAPIDERIAGQDALIAEAEGNTAARTEELATVGARLEEARAQEATLQENVAALSGEAADLAGQAAESEAQMQEARDADAALREDLDRARGELAAIGEERTGLDAAVTDLSARREQLAADTSAAQAQRDALQQDVTDLTQTLSTRSGDLETMEARIASLQAEGASVADRRSVGLAAGTYVADGMVARFDADGGFTLSPEGMPAMSGRYVYENDLLTFDDVAASAEGYAFPMICTIAFEPTGFRLAATEGAETGCAMLAGKSFVAE